MRQWLENITAYAVTKGESLIMKMRLFGIFLFAALLMAYGCGGSSDSSDSKIHGTWTIDIEQTINSSAELKAQMEQEPATKDMLKAMLGESAIIIDAQKGTVSGKMVGVDLPEEKFTILAEEGDTVKIKDESGNEMDFKVIDENTLAINDPGGMQLILKRK